MSSTSAATTSLHLIVVPVLGLYEPSFLPIAQPYLVFATIHSLAFQEELLSTPLTSGRETSQLQAFESLHQQMHHEC
jgi:hypothetical protein